MSNYIKPTISLASTASGMRSAASCENQLSKSDTEFILGIIGVGGDISNAFAPTEACALQVPIDGYCKFTSTDFGNAQVFSS